MLIICAISNFRALLKALVPITAHSLALESPVQRNIKELEDQAFEVL